MQRAPRFREISQCLTLRPWRLGEIHVFRKHLTDITRTATTVDILALYSILQIMIQHYVSVKQAFNLAVGSDITLRGWVRSRRDSKGVTFIELNDGSRFKSMQLVD